MAHDEARRMQRVRRRRRLVYLGVGLAVLTLAVLGAAIYTERPAFCPTCHEMRPYYDAWVTGRHSSTACVDCHVDPGVVAHGLHKFVALQEVVHHLQGDTDFPRPMVEALPNRRCVRCHPSVKAVAGVTFSHEDHWDRVQCRKCHVAVGHVVTLASLKEQGVLTGGELASVPATVPTPDLSKHRQVKCLDCHNLSQMRCLQCHQAPHESEPVDCSGCHVPGNTFRRAPAGG